MKKNSDPNEALSKKQMWKRKTKTTGKKTLKVSQLFFINGYAFKIKILLIGVAHATVSYFTERD